MSVPLPPHDVPSLDSESFGSPSPATKQAVLLRDQSKCWLCKNENLSVLDAAHQMAPTMVSRFEDLKFINLLLASLTHLDHEDNLITLCGNCRTLYNTPVPHWVMIPDHDTLDKYIAHERADFESRCMAANQGISQPRTLPTIDHQSVRYYPFIMNCSMQLPGNVQISDWPMPWLGDPIAALVKGVGGMFQPFTEMTTVHETGEDLQLGAQDDLRERVVELLDYWCVRDPVVKAAPPPQSLKRKTREWGGGPAGDGSCGGKDRGSRKGLGPTRGKDSASGSHSRRSSKVQPDGGQIEKKH